MELKEPDTLLLDEPTNNLDIESIEIITATIRNYQGTVLAASHDRDFLKETGIEQEISFFCKIGKNKRNPYTQTNYKLLIFAMIKLL